MAHERWSAEDAQERRDRINDADKRLEAWGKWSRTQNPLGGASSSNWFMALNPAPAEEVQAGARHVAECVPDEEAMQIDLIVASWRLDERWYWKVARGEYLYYGPREAKASHLGISLAFYKQILDELRVVTWRQLKALDKLAEKSTKRPKLAQLPAKNART
jgi:hypothetical protein